MAGKNLFCVPFIAPDIPEELLTKYWIEVEEQISRLERSFGTIKKLYQEMNYTAGEDGIKYIERLSKGSYQLLKNRMDKGAELQSLEDKELFFEIADSQLFLTLRFVSKQVTEKVSKLTPDIFQLYQDAQQKRKDYLPKQIDETLKDGEAGLLIMREEERIRLQFAADINVILVRPPVLGEIENWQRDYQAKQSEMGKSEG